MQLTRFIRYSNLLAIAVLAIGMGACTKKGAKPDDLSVPTEGAEEAGGLGDSDSGRAMGLQTVNFPFDSFALDETAKRTLKSNASILKEHSSAKVQIEGHCDQRGGIQYNIALGEKRANSVKKYMEDQGISGKRLSTVSFGKERPIDPGENEEAYAKNRRANFVITEN